MLHELRTLSGKPFRYETLASGGIIVYWSDKRGQHQDMLSLTISPTIVGLVKEHIRRGRRVSMGASRDKPPAGSLGAALKKTGQTPQQLSYLIPILVEQGYCSTSKDGRAFIVAYRGN